MMTLGDREGFLKRPNVYSYNAPLIIKLRRNEMIQSPINGLTKIRWRNIYKHSVPTVLRTHGRIRNTKTTADELPER